MCKLVKHQGRIYNILSLEDARRRFIDTDIHSISARVTDERTDFTVTLLKGTPRGATTGKTIYAEELSSRGHCNVTIPQLDISDFPAYADNCKEDGRKYDTQDSVSPEMDAIMASIDESLRLEDISDKLFAVYVLGDTLSFDVWKDTLVDILESKLEV